MRAWSRQLSADSGHNRPDSYYPTPLREALSGLRQELENIARLRTRETGEDGSARLLIELGDGETVESVLLPRQGVCVSTQAGCAVGCTFCMTGRNGLRRQLGSAEIVAQVVLARRLWPVQKVVFMGMGEPAHNLDNVIEAMNLLGTEGAIGHKNLVFSTVGDRRVFDRLPREKVRPALAISLHSTRAGLREALLPHAARIDPAELVELGEAYARETGYPIQYQWTLLKGVNDSDEELDGITRLLTGKYAVLNFIEYNHIEGLNHERPSRERTESMTLHLYRHGILAKLRQSAGQDVEGGCGQLRARSASLPLADLGQ